MLNVFTPFTPKVDINDYLTNPYNQLIKDYYSNLADLEFYNLIHNQLAIILKHSSSPDEVVEYFEWVEDLPFGDKDIEIYYASPQRFWESLFCILIGETGISSNPKFDINLAIIYKLLYSKYGHLASNKFLAPEFLFIKAERSIDNYLVNEFNTDIYYDLEERYGHAFQPLHFLNEIYESIELSKALFDKPATLYKLLKLPKGNETPNEAGRRIEALFFWVLVAIHNKITFNDWQSKEPSRINYHNVLFRFLNTAFDREYPHAPNVMNSYFKYDIEGFKPNDTNNKQDVHEQISTPTLEPLFKLNQSKRGAKTDIIRVFNALYELRYFETANGQIPTKAEFMKHIGSVLSVDLSKYETDLSQALRNTSLEANLKIFQDMQKITQEKHYEAKE
ncbi:hypothetical protein [Pontibacter roseus]|uniref:hypothetical protein n=1 Tax=Pontibacter roseus TaxID=336989 RepID=UPI0003815E4F|nr:hypothetical protein [Pontibacter roseus]